MRYMGIKTKTDARKLDGATQAHLRKMVVQAVRDGMTQIAAAKKTYGVSLRAVSKWMKLARDGGLRALRPGKRGRLPGSGRLNHRQAVRIRRLIIERLPDQLALPFYLWTRESVARLIEREYGITVSAWTAGRYHEGMGHECPEACAASVRAQRCGDRTLAERRLSADRERGEA
ncbi:helix-turn-helix domain-containing protein [Paraburkholderia sp. BR10954]|uniref:helix-turn-helix domain-containing protein n=1 Tax=Paraburkholderia sp. BR10954 TaxID=3236995 RepID=UPI0034D33826